MILEFEVLLYTITIKKTPKRICFHIFLSKTSNYPGTVHFWGGFFSFSLSNGDHIKPCSRNSVLRSLEAINATIDQGETTTKRCNKLHHIRKGTVRPGIWSSIPAGPVGRGPPECRQLFLQTNLSLLRQTSHTRFRPLEEEEQINHGTLPPTRLLRRDIFGVLDALSGKNRKC